ncbi:DUF2085 domain-containing protein [Methanocaldococcus sp.]
MNYKKAYILIVIFYILFYFGIFLAPYLAYKKFYFLSSILYKVYSPICHQLPERSFFIFNHKMAVCARCFGIYTGIFLALLIYPLVKRLDNFKTPNKIYLILSLTPMAIDRITQYIGLRESFNTLRFLTGFLAGFVIVFYIIPLYFELFSFQKKIK